MLLWRSDAFFDAQCTYLPIKWWHVVPIIKSYPHHHCYLIPNIITVSHKLMCIVIFIVINIITITIVTKMIIIQISWSSASIYYLPSISSTSSHTEWIPNIVFFSSPEPKAQVSYCRPFSSVVRNFLHFHLLLENSWLDFNQTWQESSLGVGDSKLFK